MTRDRVLLIVESGHHGNTAKVADAPAATTPAFIFSTSGLPFLATLWHWPLKKLLAHKGVRVVGEFACRGYDTWGPLWLTGGLNRKHPDEHDLERARRFADRIIRSVSPASTACCSR